MIQRRAFVAGIAAVVTVPPTAAGQQSEKVYRIGFLTAQVNVPAPHYDVR